MTKKAVVLVSGGLDSATTLAMAITQGFAVYALSVDYGQRHRIELEAAQRVAVALGAVRHLTVKVDLRAIGGSALTADLPVPQDRPAAEMATGIPITYVPARNTVFLSLALGYAETLDSFDIFLGVNAVDYSGYPDCRPAFVEQFEKLANVATKAAVEGKGVIRLRAPLIAMTKAQIIQTGARLGVDYSLTLSCYAPDAQGRACGRCDSCQLRRQGFHDAGVPDPTRYVV